MSRTDLLNGLELDEEFDPLQENDDLDLLEDDFADDDDAIEEMPLIPNMPEGVVKSGAFDAANYDDPREAIRTLFEKNPGRRPVFLSIIEMAKEGIATTELSKRVDEIQADNQSVYAPTTLCRALERAGALTVDIPVTADEVQTDDGVEYLEIKDEVNPLWTATQAGVDVLDEEREGRAIKELFEVDGKYLSIYKRVLEFCAEEPRTKKEIDGIVDHDPMVQEPRRYSNHFIELLEKADALIWKDSKWTITELGKQTLATL